MLTDRYPQNVLDALVVWQFLRRMGYKTDHLFFATLQDEEAPGQFKFGMQIVYNERNFLIVTGRTNDQDRAIQDWQQLVTDWAEKKISDDEMKAYETKHCQIAPTWLLTMLQMQRAGFPVNKHEHLRIH